MQSQKSKTKQKLEFQAIGTQWSIDADLSDKLCDKILRRIEQFDSVYSRFRRDSLVTKISQKAGTYILPDDAHKLMDFYRQLYNCSDGRVTPLIGSVMEQAGYDRQYSFQPKQLHSPPAWNDVLDLDFPKLTTLQPVQLDFGAAGKGYLVDIIGDLLHAANITDFCINAGGDILVQGKTTVGMENPDNFSEVIGLVTIENGALCASAGNRRQWANFHHTIDPVTLQSPKGIKAIWVRAKTTMLADGIATALYFVEPNKLLQHFDFEYAMIVGEDLKFSKNFKAEFFKG